VRVILADSQAIFRVGIGKILVAETDIKVVAQAETLGQTLTAVSRQATEVLLFEQGLSPTPADAVSEIIKRIPGLLVIVVVDDVNEADTVDYLRRGVRGILTRSIAPELLARCIRKVAQGETWLDNRGVNWVIKAFRAQAVQLHSTGARHHLTEREMLVISGVTKGLRNKDIAHEIGTTEQVVKNYLRKIYGKLGINDRLELALYTVHEKLLESGGSLEPPAAGAGAGPEAAPEKAPEKMPDAAGSKTPVRVR
jgi:DNA-binding NarL/FixJ family response regulator